jgi:hypothetical protein
MIPIQPWMIKAGAGSIFLSLVFYSGCYVQKKVDAERILNLKHENQEYVEVIEVFQENYDVLDQAIKDQNRAIEELGVESMRRIGELNAAHNESIALLARENSRLIEDARNETDTLRGRLSGLPLAEACHEAIMELGNE